MLGRTRAPKTIAARHANTLRTGPLAASVGSACGQQPACQERRRGSGSAGATVTGVSRSGVSRDQRLPERAIISARFHGPELVPVHLMASQMLCGGKRMRPALRLGLCRCCRNPNRYELKPLLAAAGSLDVLHVSALIHDDLMDSSDLRRGRPAAHRQFEALHANAGWLGSAAFGRAGAILLGDLLVMWSAQMLHGAGVDQSTLERALPIVEAMRTEVTCGQYLDMARRRTRCGSGHRRSGRCGPPSSWHWTTPAESWSTRPRATPCSGARLAPRWRRDDDCTSPSARTAHRWPGLPVPR